MKLNYLFFFVFLATLFSCKSSKNSSNTTRTPQNPLEAFTNLVGGEWSISSKWPDGTPFDQQKIFEWGLNKKIIKTKTFGITDTKTGSRGLRNEGIRAWAMADNIVYFYEFDVFGGITEGKCSFDGKNIYYDYTYNNQPFRDAWIFIDKDTYDYKTGVYKDNAWAALYVSGKMTRKP